MHAKDNSIIVITADQNGVIFNRTKNDVLFNGYTNMFDHPALGNHKEDLSAENYSKKILVNIFRTNYTFLKMPYLSDVGLYQYMFEEWRMYNIRKKLSRLVATRPHLKNIEEYGDKERETIYAILSGWSQDKEILDEINSFKTVQRTNRHIKYAIHYLYDKFDTNNRSTLRKRLLECELDKYLPETLFNSGIYDLFLFVTDKKSLFFRSNTSVTSNKNLNFLNI